MELNQSASGFDRLVTLCSGKRIVVLTGAGCSTESGIPDYRGPESEGRKRNPIQYQAFMKEPETRLRYWARSAVGWPRFSCFRPNDGHRALALLEAEGILSGLITQNVDRLHHLAGSKRVIELHGALAETLCLGCGARESRHVLQARIDALNPGWLEQSASLAPDGDAEIPEEAIRCFRVPTCRRCGGILKPDIIFFGENVPRQRVEEAFQMLEQADLLLVAGTSLSVYSGFRFVKKATQMGMPIGIVNIGATRGDDHADVCIDGKTGVVLPLLAGSLINATLAGSGRNAA